MKILGIHDIHNASAAIMIDGKVTAALSEERCTYRKNEMGFPKLAIEKCFEIAGVKASEIDLVAFSTKAVPPHYLKFKREFAFSIRDWLDEQEFYWKPKLFHGKTDFIEYFERLASQPKFNEENWYDFTDLQLNPNSTENAVSQLRNLREKALSQYFGIPSEKITCFDHHTCHGHYAYFASPYRDEPAIIFTADGGGDGCNGTLSIVENDKIREIARNNQTDLARIYRYITLILGMKIGEHEYKVMGLAPYSSAYEIAKTDKVFKDLFHVPDMMIEYKKRPKDLFFHFRDALADCRFDGIAGGVQQMVEEYAVEWFSKVTEKMGVNRIVFSGGLSMNVKLNQRIVELDTVKEFYVPASGGDESLCVGACYAAACQNPQTSSIGHFRNNYQGGEISNDQILEAFNKVKNASVIEGISNQEVAELIAEGMVVGRCSGPMEFGARALGNRSIIADPRQAETVTRINQKIKFRDFWMPFAPSVLESRASDYLINPGNHTSDHMTLTFDVTEEGKASLKAALHPSDQTVRAQIVTQENNQDYYSLIEAFEKVTGVGALLNTSFNLHGYPIVAKAEHLVHVFENSELDAIVAGDILLKRDSL